MSSLRLNQEEKSVGAGVQNSEFILICIIQTLQTKHTLDLLDDSDSYGVDVIRSHLTRNIANTFKEVREELIMAMDDLIPARREDSTWRCPMKRGYISRNRKSGSRSPF